MIYFLIVFLIIVLLFTIALYIYCKAENQKFTVTEYTVRSPKLKRELTLAVLSDLHNYEYGRDNVRLSDAIDKLRPDYVISAGDMIEGAMRAPGTKRTVSFLARLCKNHRFVYGCGNHEWKLIKDRTRYPKVTTEFEAGLKEAREYLRQVAPDKLDSIEPLDNRNLDYKEDNIKILGLNLEVEYFKKVVLNKTSAEHIEELIGPLNEDRFNILIGHNPDHFDSYAQYGPDLVLSGHVHGGMIATPWHRGLISPRFIPFPKYDWGEYKKNKTTMLLSRGLGNHTIHIRIFNRAELLLVHLIPEK